MTLDQLLTLAARDGILAILLLVHMFYVGRKLDRLVAAVYRHEGRGEHNGSEEE